MIVREMTAAELSMVLDWAADEGWNPGLEDADAFYAADPDGFFLAEISGDPAASISVVNHSDELAFLGLYICRPEFRGRGIGLALWEQAIGHAGDRIIGLDGVPDQQANYARSGFVRAGETRRFEGGIEAAADPEIAVATTADVSRLTSLEAEAFGFEKRRLNARWFLPGETRQTFVFPGGFATVRACRDGHKIGPLVADDMASAARLIRHIAAQAGGKIIVDVPEGNDALADWCGAQDMTMSFATARMYRGRPPVPGHGIVAAATLELG